MQSINADAYGVAALSVVQALVFKLIEDGEMSKSEAMRIYDTIADAKAAKGKLHNSSIEIDASLLLRTASAEIDARY